MVNVIATIVILAIVGGASYYIYKEKKKGTRCIGCPMAGNCSKAKAACECAKGEKK
ncbi:MAG: FeoB-associated Cys-rich membrane protein [Lachnospiraceae bacterium]|nr:FeoB-associated Cys-rich membrane protein [Lachnospiraceae bacterium]